jgi:hypothetical protein
LPQGDINLLWVDFSLFSDKLLPNMGETEKFSPQESSRRGFRNWLRTALARRQTLPAISSTNRDIIPAEEVLEGEIVDSTKQIIKRRHTVRISEEYIEADTLSQLREGRSGWTVPWAMAITKEGDCYLNGSYTFQNNPGGTVQMLVENTKDGLEVSVPHGYKYQPSRAIPWLGAREEDLLPVVKVKRGRTSY